MEEVPEDYVWKKTRVDPELGIVMTPATSVEPHQTHTIMNNLWYNNGKWYAIVEGDNHVSNIKMSRNQEIICLHVKNATEWLANTEHRVVPGDTLIFDFIFYLHPTAIGHWCEMMFPLFSILKRSSFSSPATNFVLLHLKRSHLMEWVRSVMAATLGVPPGGPLPPIILQEETDNIFAQLMQPLEGVPSDTWVSFERAMVVRDLFTGGKRSFASTADAQLFRYMIYQNHGLTPPPLSSTPRTRVPPKVITFQRKAANRRVLNEAALLDLLRSYAPVNVVEFNASHSFKHQLETMSRTGLFVSVHTSNLANAPFLPPGSAVLELIQRFWNWNGLDRSFAEQTTTMGDIHHFAWRAYHLNQTKYLSPRDEFKFGNWSDAQCKTEECVEAHTNVDIIVNLDQVKLLLDARLPLVFAGASVRDTWSLWPPNSPGLPQPWEIEPGVEAWTKASEAQAKKQAAAAAKR